MLLSLLCQLLVTNLFLFWPPVYGDDFSEMNLHLDTSDRVLYQVEKPFGTDIGGVDSKLFRVEPTAEFDTWITVGSDNGNADNGIRCVNFRENNCCQA